MDIKKQQVLCESNEDLLKKGDNNLILIYFGPIRGRKGPKNIASGGHIFYSLQKVVPMCFEKINFMLILWKPLQNR